MLIDSSTKSVTLSTNATWFNTSSYHMMLGTTPLSGLTEATEYVHNVRIYNGALSAQEVACLDACELGGMVHEWAFNEASASSHAYDGAGTVNGTLVNGASRVAIPASPNPPPPDGSPCLCVSSANVDSGLDLGPASNVATTNGSFSVSGWLCLNSPITSGEKQYLLGSYPGTLQNGVFAVDAENSNGNLFIRTEGQNFRRPKLQLFDPGIARAVLEPMAAHHINSECKPEHAKMSLHTSTRTVS